MVFETYISGYLKKFNDLHLQCWNYSYGCVLTGCYYLYQITEKQEYKNALLQFGNEYIDENGIIRGFVEEEHNVDLMASGRVLYYLYDITGEERYAKGIHYIRRALGKQPRTSFGNFWHKEIYPYQVWLDGLYMVQPFYMEYEKRFCEKAGYKDTLNQFKNVRKYLYDEKKHLYYHGYDEKRVMIWADKETGCSPSFWLRAMGWYLMALCDCIEICEDKEAETILGELLKEAIDGILLYRDSRTGMFYQLIDRPDLEDNYLETSGSAMVSYALLKGHRLGVLKDETYFHTGEMILAALEASKYEVQADEIHLVDTCASAGLGPRDERDGSTQYYLSEKRGDDNTHGVAAFMMAYSEWLRKERRLWK